MLPAGRWLLGAGPGAPVVPGVGAGGIWDDVDGGPGDGRPAVASARGELGYRLTPIRRTGHGEGPAQRPWPHQERRAWNRAAVSLEGALWALESHFPGTGGNGIDKALARYRRRLTGVSSLNPFLQEHEP